MSRSKNQDSSVLLDVVRAVRDEVVDRADAYLDGTYDPKEEASKKFAKGATTALLVVSLLSGLAFSGPAEINGEQANTQLKQAPIVMDIDDYMNSEIDDDDDADEQKGAKVGFVAKFKQAVLNLPQSVRLLIITPLWALGTALMTLVSFLWDVIFATPLGAVIASFATGFAVLVGLFAVTAKILFPDVPLKKMLTKRNVLVLGIAAALLACIDAIAPMFWHQYPLASAGIKLLIGASVIGIICHKFKKFFQREKYNAMPEAAV